MELRKFIATTIRECLNEQKESIIRLTFSNITDYNKTISILYKNGFKRPTSLDKGNGYYETDDISKTIEFNVKLKDNILPLLSDVKYKIDSKKPLGYKTFNHGGYLD